MPYAVQQASSKCLYFMPPYAASKGCPSINLAQKQAAGDASSSPHRSTLDACGACSLTYRQHRTKHPNSQPFLPRGEPSAQTALLWRTEAVLATHLSEPRSHSARPAGGVDLSTPSPNNNASAAPWVLHKPLPSLLAAFHDLVLALA